MPTPDLKQRLRQVFGDREPPGASRDSLAVYREHLRERLEHPCFLHLVHEDGASFEALQLVDLIEEIDAEQGLLARVKRVSDDREFQLPLAHTECPPEDAANHEPIETYCQWFLRASSSLLGSFDRGP